MICGFITYIYTQKKNVLFYTYTSSLHGVRFPCFDYFPLPVYYKRSINLPVYNDENHKINIFWGIICLLVQEHIYPVCTGNHFILRGTIFVHL